MEIGLSDPPALSDMRRLQTVRCGDLRLRLRPGPARQEHRGQHQDAAEEHPGGGASPPSSTANSAANTGSMLMMIAARVGARWRCAHVWPIIAPGPANTAM